MDKQISGIPEIWLSDSDQSIMERIWNRPEFWHMYFGSSLIKTAEMKKHGGEEIPPTVFTAV